MPDLCWKPVLHGETSVARSKVFTRLDFQTEVRQCEGSS